MATIAELSRQGISHPLADSIDPDAGIVVTESRAPVVTLSSARADLLSRLGGSRLVLVTGPGTLLTRPLSDVLHAAGATWVVRQDDGTVSDGVTGLTYTSYRDVVAGAGGTAPPGAPPSDTDGLTARDEAGTAGRVLRLEIAVRSSPQSRGLGRTAARAVEHLTGNEPVAWGPHEPATERWDEVAIGAYAAQRAPEPSYLVLTGIGAIGSLLIRRTANGIEELTTLDIALGTEDVDAVHDADRRVRELFDALPGQPIVHHAMATTSTGRADLLIASGLRPAAEPLQMVVGPATLRDRDVSLAEAAERFGAVRQVRGRMVALRFPLAVPGVPDAGWERAQEIARWMGRTSGPATPDETIPRA